MMLKRLWMLCVLLFLTVTLCSCYPTDKLVFWIRMRRYRMQMYM